MNCHYPAALSLLALLAACSGATPEFGSDANQIAATYGVPQSVKIVAAEMLHRCNIPARGRKIYWNWESRAGEASYRLLLSSQQFEDRNTTHCLETQAKALGVVGEIALAIEPPPPPSDLKDVASPN